jgi:hypothetical protein
MSVGFMLQAGGILFAVETIVFLAAVLHFFKQDQEEGQ